MLFLALSVLAALVADPAAAASGVIRGASTRGKDADFQALAAAGGTHVRVYALWKYMEPKLESVDPSLSVAALRANHSLVTHWASTVADWTHVDAQVSMSVKHGLTPLIEVGEGTFNGLPAINGTIADPGVIGRELYLAYQYRAARAVADRHGHASPLFQIENELNEAYLAGLAGQRLFHAVGSPWRDWDFLTQLLATLRTAVTDAGTGSRVTTNLHTDVPAVVHDLLLLPGFYESAARAWSSSVDVLSFDAYPNMFSPVPLHIDEVANRGTRIAKASGHEGVFVMETGLSVRADTVNDTVPLIGAFSPEAQAAYVEGTCGAVRSAGLGGFVLFFVSDQPGIEPPPGGYTSEDIRGLTAVADIMSGEHVLESVAWLASREGRNFVTTRLGKELKVGNGWGVIDTATGKPRPALASLAACFAAPWHGE
jgi:hypothetical protein